MEILEIFDTDLKQYENKFMEAARGKKIIDTEFGVDEGIYWMRMWIEELI